MNLMRRAFIAAMTAGVLSGCGVFSGEKSQAHKSWSPSNKRNPSTLSGVQMWVRRLGMSFISLSQA